MTICTFIGHKLVAQQIPGKFELRVFPKCQRCGNHIFLRPEPRIQLHAAELEKKKRKIKK